MIACDNKASITNAFQHKNRANVTQGSFDILWAIQQIHLSLPITIYFQYVKGHRDEVKQSLNLLETLNYIMDKRAGQYRNYIEESAHYEYSHMHWHSNWHCQINNSYITLELEYHIKDTIYQQKMKKTSLQTEAILTKSV